MGQFTRILARAAVAACILSAAAPSMAQTYPSRRITLIVGFAAGGFADTVGRTIGQKISDQLGQPVIVENRAGAGGNIAHKAIASADPDGYSVLVTTTALAINATMYRKLNFAMDELKAVAIPGFSPEVFAAAPDRPSNLKDFLAWAKGREISFATAGVGSGSHLAGEYFFRSLAGVKANHVPFRGGAPAIQAVTAGQVDLVVTSFGATSHIQAGTLKGLAFAGTGKSNAAPGAPAFADAGFPGFEAGSWVGFFVPAKTDAAIAQRLNAAINEAVKDAGVAEQLDKLGLTLTARDVAATQAYFNAEVANWSKIVRAADVYVD